MCELTAHVRIHFSRDAQQFSNFVNLLDMSEAIVFFVPHFPLFFSPVRKVFCVLRLLWFACRKKGAAYSDFRAAKKALPFLCAFFSGFSALFSLVRKVFLRSAPLFKTCFRPPHFPNSAAVRKIFCSFRRDFARGQEWLISY